MLENQCRNQESRRYGHLPEDRWESLRYAARRIGLAYQTLKNWRYQNRLPFPVYTIGRSDIRVKIADVDAWMESTRVLVKKI